MTTWHKACGSAANCVEISRDGTNVLVRDSKDPDGPVLVFDEGEWAAHIDAAKAGALDWTIDADGAQS